MEDNEFDMFLETAMQQLMAKQETLQSDFGLGSMARWWLDQTTETVQFFDEQDRLVVEADILEIGSFAPSSGTWKWAWSNASVQPALREKALELKQLGALTGMDLFTREQAFSIADESMAWELAAMAVHHLDAVGCYRAPSEPDGPTVFLALTAVKNVSYQ